MKWRKAVGNLRITKTEFKDLFDDCDEYEESLYYIRPEANAIDISDGTLISFEDGCTDEDIIFDRDGNEYIGQDKLYGNEFRGSFEYKRHRSGNGYWYEIRNIAFFCSIWMKEAETPLEDLVEKPESKFNIYDYQGEKRTLNTIAKMNNVTYQSLKTRLDKGMSLDEAIEVAKSRKIHK